MNEEGEGKGKETHAQVLGDWDTLGRIGLGDAAWDKAGRWIRGTLYRSWGLGDLARRPGLIENWRATGC